jgi:hypothetical protein
VSTDKHDNAFFLGGTFLRNVTFMSVIIVWSNIVTSPVILSTCWFSSYCIGVHTDAVLLYMLLYQLEAKQ